MDSKKSAINRAMAAEIKGARIAAGLSVEALSEQSGLTVGTLNRMSSKDVRDINITQMHLIAKAVGVPLAELVQRAEANAARKVGAMSDGGADNDDHEAAYRKGDLDLAAQQRDAESDLDEQFT